MPTTSAPRWSRQLVAVRLVLAVALGSCATPAQPTTSPAAGPTIAPPATVRPLNETWVEPFVVEDFDRVHDPVDAAGNAAVIFGALPIASGRGLDPALAAFLGRWEGYGYDPPIKRDWKYVLAVTEITREGGSAYLWAGTNLQFPAVVERIRFRVRGTGRETAIEWVRDIDGKFSLVRLRHAGTTDALEAFGSGSDPRAPVGRVLLRKDATDHRVCRDYPAHLASRGTAWVPYSEDGLAAWGDGWLVSLPPGYEAEPDRRWPLIVFLHGSGDRGDNGLLLVQNSPFRVVSEGRDLDAIMVAPLLRAGQPAFPTAYLEGVLDAALATYRVDRERVAVTGLSMGGEAAYRLARSRPGRFDALAVLCGFDAAHFPGAIAGGYAPIEAPVEGLRDTRVLVVHGDQDAVVPLEAAEGTVAAMTEAGVDVRFEVLPSHDHDVGTETYADPSFYDWLLGRDGAWRAMTGRGDMPRAMLAGRGRAPVAP